MGAGVIGTHVLTDIANAIRRQGGTSALLRPGEMAAAVAALDGTDAGGFVEQAYKERESGALPESVLTDVADAIRAKNGLATQYRPGEMADAIAALTWDKRKVRALLLEDGTFEVNYYEDVCSVTGGTVAQAYEVDTAGYEKSSARPWNSVKAKVTKAYIDASVAEAGITNCSSWFYGFTKLIEVWGFENLSGVTSARTLFSGCFVLESIYATSFVNAIDNSDYVISNCNKLVGGADCYVPNSRETGSVLKLGPGGVLTDPNNDARVRYWAHLYDDGCAVLTVSDEPDPARTLVASGRICANAVYRTGGYWPWNGASVTLTSAVFAEDMAGIGCASLSYLFNYCTGLTSIEGLGNLRGTRTMRSAFAMTAVTSLDLRGLDPSELTDLSNCFSNCTALSSIYADADWGLPEGAAGSNCFYKCASLVGGNGTAYSDDNVDCTYMRIDREGQPGYLTEA